MTYNTSLIKYYLFGERVYHLKKLNSTFLYLHQEMYVDFSLVACNREIHTVPWCLLRLCSLRQVNLTLFYNVFAYLNYPY